MSDDIYDEYPKPVQSNEIRPVSHMQWHAPDAHIQAGPTYHQGANYGQADTTVTVVDGTQCVHDGVPHYGGETVRVPKAVAKFMIRSGWAFAGPNQTASLNRRHRSRRQRRHRPDDSR